MTYSKSITEFYYSPNLFSFVGVGFSHGYWIPNMINLGRLKVL